MAISDDEIILFECLALRWERSNYALISKPDNFC
nr:MAG TPA: hypothetical protein [Caudoviricetes sp.]